MAKKSTSSKSKVALGIDFGTESVRAVLIDLAGNELASSVAKYKHGQIVGTLPGTSKALPTDYAFQHPDDWMTSSVRAVRAAMREAGLEPDNVIGIGVDFTSCTMLPCQSDGTPLCKLERFAKQPMAWPKLWKHHGAGEQTQRINQVAEKREEPFLKRYGGGIGVEWFFPKTLETLEKAPAVYRAADLFIEAGDWYVWQLTGSAPEMIPRSTCQAGYKAMWSASDGYPSTRFFRAVNPDFANVVSEKMAGQLMSPGMAAGMLDAKLAKRMGLAAGTPVSAAIIDAHAGVPGAGAADPGTLVMVMGTSSCHMLNAEEDRYVPGVAGVVDGGILPDFFGYETGQAAVGDAFDWLRRTVGREYDQLTLAAEQLAPGSDGLVFVDWLNGCRTPLMDEGLKGKIEGLTLAHRPEHLYRALIEGTACGVRWIADVLREGGVTVDRFVATGGLPHHNPLIVEIYANVLGAPITVHPSQYGPAVGAAILGALAAGSSASGFRSPSAAIRAMASAPGQKPKTVRPKAKSVKAYEAVYQRYRAACGQA